MQKSSIEHLASAMWSRGAGENRLNLRHTEANASRNLGVLVFDSKGLVIFCSDAIARMTGSSSTEIIGTEVRNFMPGIPLDPATEGYNVAFGAFSAARRMRQSWTLYVQDGGAVQLDGYFAMLKMPSGYVFCLELHQRPEVELILAPGAIARTEARRLRSSASAAGSAMARKNGVGRSLSRLWHKFGLRASLIRKPLRQQLQPGSGLDSQAPAALAGRTTHAIRPPHVQLLLDRDYRVGFASSAIEDLLAHDYEKVIGMPVSDVLPELLPRLGGMCSIKSAKAKLREMGSFISHARHANGDDIAVVVQLREKKCDQLIPLLISLPA